MNTPCACKGKYPNLENHTEKECWTKFHEHKVGEPYYVNKETKMQELERRIAALEARPYPMSTTPMTRVADNQDYLPQKIHYHNGAPCYNNPCVMF